MRKIIVSMNVTLNGFIAGPGDELDWHFTRWTQEMSEYLCGQLSRADTILLGSNTYKAMAAYWPYCNADISFPREDMAFADMMNSHTKIVFTKTAFRLRWQNSKRISGNIDTEIIKLKQQPGKDIIVLGSGKLVSSLVNASLIDEYILWVHPVVLSNGKPLFNSMGNKIMLRLSQTKRFRSGVVALYYAAVDKPGNAIIPPASGEGHNIHARK